MIFNIFINSEGDTIVEINYKKYTPGALCELVEQKLLLESRARNIIERRKIPHYPKNESPIIACLSHLDNLR